MIRPPAFWTKPNHPASRLLAPASYVWQAVTDWRRAHTPSRKSSIPAFCIGNITTGGAGKTPTALALAKLLQAHGEKPAFGNRGYGGAVRDHVVQVDVTHHTAAQVGDEALLLATTAPTFVCSDRYAAASAAAAAGATQIIFDDGLQNPQLTYDRALLVIDGEFGLGNGRIMPAGPLRETLTSALPRCHAALIIGEDQQNLAAHIENVPIFYGRLTADASALNPATRYLAFAGIGRPEKFFATCQSAGLQLSSTRAFPDHHAYNAAELIALAQSALEQGAELLTTTKDTARLSPAWQKRVTVLPVALQLTAPDDFLAIFLDKK